VVNNEKMSGRRYIVNATHGRRARVNMTLGDPA